MSKTPNPNPQEEPKGTRLNKFIANAGVCSRREADNLIADEKIKVNGKVVSEMGFKIHPGDKVVYKGKLLKGEKLVYVLLNKPRDFITTTNDPQNRRTVMDLVKTVGDERIFPVGRLDRNTTGLLLLTNDGDLTKILSHPSHKVKKIYKATLDKPLEKNDFEALKAGFTLDDGPVVLDDIAYTSANGKEIGVELHLGKNRIVRRIFEHFEYEVELLDRVVFADLTKKDLPRGKWRFLSPKEIGILKKRK
jgi:23S rRNA pseudouridine2605 synthase